MWSSDGAPLAHSCRACSVCVSIHSLTCDEDALTGGSAALTLASLPDDLPSGHRGLRPHRKKQPTRLQGGEGPGLPLQGNAAAALRDAASRGRLEPFHRAASQAWPVARHAAVLGCADGGGGEAGAARARALHRNAVDNAGPCVDEARGPDLLGAECSLLELSVLYGRFHGQASLLGTWAFTFGKAAVRCGAAQAVSSWT